MGGPCAVGQPGPMLRVKGVGSGAWVTQARHRPARRDHSQSTGRRNSGI